MSSTKLTEQKVREFFGIENEYVRASACGDIIPELGFSTPYTGVELEIEGYNFGNESSKPFGLWYSKNDDSLRGISCELVLSMPCKDTKLYQQVGTVARHIANWTNQIQPSFRTSTHIHIDVSQLLLPQFIKLYTAFALFEELFFNWHSNSNRRESIFCTPCSANIRHMRDMLNGLYYNDTSMFNKAATKSLHSNVKYFAINLGAVRTYGSIEIRMFPLLKSEQQLRRVLYAIHRIYHTVIDLNVDILPIVSQAAKYKDASVLLSTFFHADLALERELRSIINWNEALLESIANTAPLLFVGDFRNEYYNLIS